MVDDAAARWLSEAQGLWWWRLPAEQFRIAMVIIARSELGEDGRRVLITTTDRLAAQCGVDRGVIRRALLALEAGGFCTVSSTRGVGGKTLIGLLQRTPDRDSRGHLETSERTAVSSHVGAISTITSSTSRPFDDRSGDHLQSADVAGDIPDKPPPINHLQSTEPTICDGHIDQRSALGSGSDPRSEISGRSPDPENLTRSLSIAPSKPTKPRKSKSTAEERAAKLAESIPERAWAAADYLRKQILAVQPGSTLAGEQWAGRCARRLAWAKSFARLHAKLARAANVLELDGAGASAIWDEIARTVAWLFNRDPSKPGQSATGAFVVQSPDALDDKWDRIQAVRQNQVAAAQARSAPRGAAPDNRPPPEFKRMSDGWGPGGERG